MSEEDMEAGQIRLWPGVAPGSETWTHDEETVIDSATGTRAVRNVVVPTVTPVLPSTDAGNGSAVVIAPGGGFAALAWDHEGMPMARWFAERGVTAFVLKYRLAPMPSDPAEVFAKLGPMPEPGDPKLGAWLLKAVGNAPDLGAADGEQAIRTVRTRAAAWELDPARIGVLGFSAGGTVALRTGATTDPDARPSFVANVYGAFLGRDVPAEAPPQFAVVAADDSLCCGMVLDAVQHWIAAGASTELHMYESGGHGFALTKQGAPTDTWADRLQDWLTARGVLPH